MDDNTFNATLNRDIDALLSKVAARIYTHQIKDPARQQLLQLIYHLQSLAARTVPGFKEKWDNIQPDKPLFVPQPLTDALLRNLIETCAEPNTARPEKVWKDAREAIRKASKLLNQHQTRKDLVT